jgi:hypothetical protein
MGWVINFQTDEVFIHNKPKLSYLTISVLLDYNEYCRIFYSEKNIN